MKALTPQTQRILEASDGFVDANRKNHATAKFLQLVTLYMQLKDTQKQIDAIFKTQVGDEMKKYGVKEMNGSWGIIQFVSRPSYQEKGKVAPCFYKKVLDTDEIKKYQVKHGKLPEGVRKSVTKYLRKDFK